MKKVSFVADTSWHAYTLKLGLIQVFQNKGLEAIAISPKSDNHHIISKRIQK